MSRTFYEIEHGLESLQFVGNAGEERASISCEDPYCGDTQSGIGATVSIMFNRDEAKGLADAIYQWLNA